MSETPNETTEKEAPSVENEDIGELAAPSRGNKSKLMMIIGLAVLVLGAAGLFFSPLGKSLLGGGNKEEAPKEKKEVVDVNKVSFTSMPEILINLRSADGRSSFLKATFVIESPDEEAAKKIDKVKPLLVDQFQIYLRELDVEDLKGSVGMQRIRQELINRANALIAPEKINNVLFKDFLVQ